MPELTWLQHYEQQASVVRLWILVGDRRESYVPGFEGTFEEAVIEATRHAAFWKTRTHVYEADPERYRLAGGLKRLWATISVPKESPVQI